MVPIDIDDEVHAAIEVAAATCSELPNQILRRLLGLPLAADQDAGARLDGELAPLVAAGLIALGDPVFATGSYPQHHAAAVVAEGGHLLTPDGTLHPGPDRLISALFGERFAAHGWACLTAADGARLEALRQRHLAETAPHLLPHGPGELARLITLAVLAPGDELRLTLPDCGGLNVG